MSSDVRSPGRGVEKYWNWTIPEMAADLKTRLLGPGDHTTDHLCFDSLRALCACLDIHDVPGSCIRDVRQVIRSKYDTLEDVDDRGGRRFLKSELREILALLDGRGIDGE